MSETYFRKWQRELQEMTPTHWRILAELDAGTLEWGAAVGACWSVLVMNGYVEPCFYGITQEGKVYGITQKGKDALKERGDRVMFDVSWEAQIGRIRKEYEDEKTALRARIAELEAEVKEQRRRDAVLDQIAEIEEETP
jgi:hypothetical protein